MRYVQFGCSVRELPRFDAIASSRSKPAFPASSILLEIPQLAITVRAGRIAGGG
jgi:hypothetical protein